MSARTFDGAVCVIERRGDAALQVHARAAAAVTTASPRAALAALGRAADAVPAAPALAGALRDAGARAVWVLGDAGAPDWIDTRHACGWLRRDLGGGGTSAARCAEPLLDALAAGFVDADAVIAATLQIQGALDGGDARALPLLSWGDEPVEPPPAAPGSQASLGLYAIVDSAARVRQVLDAGVRTVQLRIKTPPEPGTAWLAALRSEIAASVAAARAASAELFVNDHWQLAAELGAGGVHLGQEDLLGLGRDGRQALRATGMALGVSSHSLWELCRALALGPGYVACGPVWPTLTKEMPWRPQGMDNLAWWCRMAGVPVVAIGGILEPAQVAEAAACGAAGVCIVRGLGDDPRRTAPTLQRALEAGRERARSEPPPLRTLHPSLPADHDPAAGASVAARRAPADLGASA
ncbi:thiamine phosphate synthase [Piscinibacter koreensis]|uniref:Thiamine phosphate synthase n=1 Tax=Piscinibacter koreensis TaxID=2742824 RepID=A0A7Y6NQ54_9BURK|nr:thiamine phosphate synthase [Schlegelella koreensis]NUZ07260.1 thiamine phosphate synthase [Schlegelella koreensis]